MHTSTHWNVMPSFTFDALCWLNVLTGDPFYVRYYPQEYEAFKPRLTPAAVEALSGLKTKVKDQGHIISAFLCLYFSATVTTTDQTLTDLSNTVEDSSTMYRVLKASPYYDAKEWHCYESIRPELKILLNFLRENGFAEHWHSTIFPHVQQRIAILQEELAPFNVIIEDEAMLGFALPSDEITVYVLHYVQPHGMRILGTRFLTDVTNGTSIQVRTAVHEMFHPPYDPHSAQVQECLLQLEADTFLKEAFVNHNPDYGYNSFEGFIEEDCVRALDQIVNEKFGIATEARERWRTEDEGMHVFAACLYAAMQEEQYNQRGEVFEQFLARMVRSTLKPGGLQHLYTKFMQNG
jgi:hypothetical protein